MHQNPSYTLTHLAGEPYLLPYGQLIADFRKGMQLNETGELIWNKLSMRQSRELLLLDLKREFDIIDNIDKFEQDITNFLDLLLCQGVVLEDSLPNAVPYAVLSAAGIRFLLCGPKEVFSDDFNQFLLPPEAGTNLDAILSVTWEPAPPMEGIQLLSDPNLAVYEQKDTYILDFCSASQIRLCTMEKNGRNATFYVNGACSDSLRYDLFHAIRTIFLYYAASRDMCAIHSASILYGGKAWLFSGPSGTGKSTHTGLWNRYVGTPFINGDLNLLAFDSDGTPVIHGIPWCGTSGICDNQTYELGGIVLLKQDKTNILYPLTESQKQLCLLQRLISPRWKADMLTRLAGIIGRLTPRIQVHRLGCTISEEAVRTIQDAIDSEVAVRTN